jgi:hypothetical protein
MASQPNYTLFAQPRASRVADVDAHNISAFSWAGCNQRELLNMDNNIIIARIKQKVHHAHFLMRMLQVVPRVSCNSNWNHRLSICLPGGHSNAMPRGAWRPAPESIRSMVVCERRFN